MTKLKKKAKVLCLFDYCATTGFATVSQNIVQQLKKYYGPTLLLDIIAVNYFEDFHTEYDETVRVWPASLTEVEIKGEKRPDAYGRYVFLSMLAMDDYDGVFIIQDPETVLKGMMIDYAGIVEDKKKENKKIPKSVFYYPTDGKMFREDFHKQFAVFDQLISYTKYGRSETLRLYPELKSKLIDIPHGVNLRDFKPLPESDIERYRKELLGDNAGKFVFLNLNRNQYRKDIPTTIFGFEEYKNKYNPNSFLYLHTTPKDFMGWDLRRVLDQTSLIEGVDYCFPPEEWHNSQADQESLNKIYNIADAFVTTTTGEGWGLTISEAMSCCIPVIAPLHTSIVEMSNNGQNIWGLENVYPYVSVRDNYIREQCDFLEVAEKMNELEICDETDRYTKIQAAYDAMYKIQWGIICDRWIEIFKKWFF